MAKEFKVGYTTGTFDVTHSGHFNLLKHMSHRCDVVIVGLVTDELASRQKRIPILEYAVRESILINCRSVDIVIPYNGRLKLLDHQHFRFDVMFVGDDYEDCEEYADLVASNIPVIYLPRTPNISTTKCLRQVSSAQVQYYPSSTAYCVYSFLGYVYKTIPVGCMESNSTADVYKLGYPFPRNSLTNVQYPNIAGANATREIRIHQLLKGKGWYPVISIEQISLGKTGVCVSSSPSMEPIHHLQLCRATPEVVYVMTSRHCGSTLRDYWQHASSAERSNIWVEIERIVSEMCDMEVVHGDLHAQNICIQPNLAQPTHPRVSIIDFSWCQHKSFQMTADEARDYTQKLINRHDWSFFTDTFVTDSRDER